MDNLRMDIVLVWLHVVGNLVWIGSILAVGAAIVSPFGDPRTRGQIATRIYLRLAVPAFLVSFVCGAARLLMDPRYYLKEHHWMHGKLLFALIVIALHHVIGGRAKKLGRGTVQEAGPTATLSLALAVSAVVAAFFAIVKIPG
jgi:protoporphyrinogen IX oxidase